MAAQDWTVALRAGSALRFGIEADDGRASTVWRLWTMKYTDDVYVAGRENGGWIKASLHQSGSWQHGFTVSAQADGWGADLDSRHFQLWSRPDEVAQGVTHALRIIVPTSQLRTGPSTKGKDRDVRRLPPPQESDGVAFDVFLLEPTHQNVQLDKSALVGRIDLPTGGRVEVVARVVSFDGAAAEEVFADQLEEAAAAAQARGNPLPAGTTGRIAIHGFDPDLGTVKFVEMAVDLPPSAPSS